MKKLRFRLARLHLLAVVGFGRLEACRHHNIQNRLRRCQGVISRLRSVKKLRKLDGAQRLPEMIEGIEFKDGIKQKKHAA